MTSNQLFPNLATSQVAAAEAVKVEMTATAPTKQQLRDAELRTKREAKAEAAKAKKAATAAKRADGVIGTIRQMLDTATGTTRAECLAALTAKFPDRDPMGMVVTVGIQFSRLAASTGRKIENYKHETRGRVYGFADVLVRPEIVLVHPQGEQVKVTEEVKPVEVTEPAKPAVGRRVQGAKPGRQS